MASCTITFSDLPNGTTDVKVVFDPPIDNLPDGAIPTDAQRMGWMFCEALAETNDCLGVSATGEGSDGEPLTVSSPPTP